MNWGIERFRLLQQAQRAPLPEKTPEQEAKEREQGRVSALIRRRLPKVI